MKANDLGVNHILKRKKGSKPSFNQLLIHLKEVNPKWKDVRKTPLQGIEGILKDVLKNKIILA